MNCLQMPPLSLYVHLPWCVKKCPYCDFNSHELRTSLPEEAYVDALVRDFRAERELINYRQIKTVFFGGGTPSLFNFKSITKLLNTFSKNLDHAAEITLEANPGTVERGRLADYRAAGINRISLGAQSFALDSLRRIGRIHGAREIFRAVEDARTAGIENFNLDLMYGLPNQTLAAALADLEQAIALAPAHISHYQLSLEPQTPFAKRPPPLPDDEALWAMQTNCQTMLADAGYAQYEVSAYARPARQCRHNLNYWRYGDYLGIGAGAHGKLTTADGRIMRRAKQRHPTRYMQTAGSNPACTSETTVEGADRVFEFMLNVLRLNAGFDGKEFSARTGSTLAAAEPGLSQAVERCLLDRQGESFSPTRLGRTFLNDLQMLFLPSARGMNIA